MCPLPACKLGDIEVWDCTHYYYYHCNRYFGTLGPLNLAVEAVFALCVILLTVKLVVCLVSTKMNHLKSVWGWIEVLKIAFAISSIVVYCKKTAVILDTIEELKNSKGERKKHFVNVSLY